MSKPISFYHPHYMTDMAHKVVEIMQRDGGITHLIAVHYNIGDVRREVARIREAIPYGHVVVTVRGRKDADGNQYTRWVLLKSAAQVPGVMYGKHNDFRMAA